MVSKSRAQRTPGGRGTVSMDYRAMFRETRRAARKAMRQYGEPTMTLEELRNALKQELGDASLAGWIEKEREAGL